MMESGHTPNPHILVCYTTREFASAQLDIERLEAGGAPRAPSARYEALAERKDRLMVAYKRKEMPRREYLVQMGGVSLKTQRELSKRGIPAPKNVPRPRPATATAIPSAPSAAAAAEARNDSFSETRAMSPICSDQDSDTEQENPFPQQAKDARRAIQPLVDARQRAQKCTKCRTGFQPSRKLHLVCQKCTRWQHKRCAGVAKTRDPFVCLLCVPDTVLDADLGEQFV